MEMSLLSRPPPPQFLELTSWRGRVHSFRLVSSDSLKAEAAQRTLLKMAATQGTNFWSAAKKYATFFISSNSFHNAKNMQRFLFPHFTLKMAATQGTNLRAQLKSMQRFAELIPLCFAPPLPHHPVCKKHATISFAFPFRLDYIKMHFAPKTRSISHHIFQSMPI